MKLDGLFVVNIKSISRILNSSGMIDQLYFKEYQCYDFYNHQTQQSNNSLEGKESYEDRIHSSLAKLPSVVIDRNGRIEVLYLLKWKFDRNRVVLNVRKLSDSLWRKIEIQKLPLFITISQDQLFAVYESSILIQALEDKQKRVIKNIGDGKIVSFNRCLVQIQNKGGKRQVQHQAGVSIVFFDRNYGYFSREFSFNTHTDVDAPIEKITKVLGFIKFINKPSQFRYFQVIIPNSIALAFNSNNQFSFFNLQTKQIIQSTRTTLINGSLAQQKPIIRWRQFNNNESEKLLLLVIGYHSSLQLFRVYFRYLKQYEQQLKQALFQDINYGNFIDWTTISIKPFISVQSQHKIVEDLAISSEGITYYCKQEQNSQIGVMNYFDLKTIFHSCPAITQEAAVWRRYCEDEIFSQITQNNRFFIPNRYPPSMVPKNSHQKLDKLKRKLLSNWRNHYKFKSLLVYNEVLLIIRQSSISIFLSIQKDLFQYQNFTQQKLKLFDQLHVKKSFNFIDSIFFRTNCQFENPLVQGEIDRNIFQQKRYKVLDKQDITDESQAQQKINDKFDLLVEEIERILGDKIEAKYEKMNISEFQYLLTYNLICDKISFYHLIANSKIFRIQSQNARQNSKQYEMHECIIKLINYYYDLLQRSQNYYIKFGDNLLSLFMKKKGYLNYDTDTVIFYYLRLLLDNIVPKKISNYYNSQIINEDRYFKDIEQNQFLNFVIDLLKEVIDKEGRKKSGQEKIRILREELSRFISIGFLQQKSIYFSRMWNNRSLLQALLLSNLSQRFYEYICQYLLKDSIAKLISSFSKLRRYMSDASMQAFQSLLFYNLRYHSYLQYPKQASQQFSQYGGDPQYHFSLQRRYEITKKYNRNRQFEGQGYSQKLFQDKLRQLKQSKQFDSDLAMDLKYSLENIDLFQSEQLLQFYQKALIETIELFSSKLNVLPNEEQDENILLDLKKIELMNYLQIIQLCLQMYIDEYVKYYEEDRGNTFELQKNILCERFIDPSTIQFFKIDEKGLLCCSATIKCLQYIIQHKKDLNPFKLGLDEISSYIEGANYITNSIFNEELQILNLLYQYNSKDVQFYLDLNQDKQRQIQAACANLQGYDFIPFLRKQSGFKVKGQRNIA